VRQTYEFRIPYFEIGTSTRHNKSALHGNYMIVVLWLIIIAHLLKVDICGAWSNKQYENTNDNDTVQETKYRDETKLCNECMDM
jgi:hypothetical protein